MCEGEQCIRACVSNKRAHVSLYDHTPTGACECPPADRHTRTARREFWATNENAVLLTDMPKHTTCNHFKDVFLRVSTSNCFKQMSLLRLGVCNLPSAGWRALKSEWETDTHTHTHTHRRLKASMRWTSMSPPLTHLPKSPVPPGTLSALFTLGCEDGLIMARVISPCSHLSHLSATIIVLSVWTGKLSAGCLV